MREPNNKAGIDKNKFVYFDQYETFFDYEGKCFLEGHAFRKEKAIVKIQNKKERRTIYRQACGGNAKGLKKNEIGLSRKDIGLLKANPPQCSLVVSRNVFTWIMFFWKHPNHATRVSFKMGLLSLTLGVISIVMGIISVIYMC